MIGCCCFPDRALGSRPGRRPVRSREGRRQAGRGGLSFHGTNTQTVSCLAPASPAGDPLLTAGCHSEMAPRVEIGFNCYRGRGGTGPERKPGLRPSPSPRTCFKVHLVASPDVRPWPWRLGHGPAPGAGFKEKARRHKKRAAPPLFFSRTFVPSLKNPGPAVRRGNAPDAIPQTRRARPWILKQVQDDERARTPVDLTASAATVKNERPLMSPSSG